MKKYINYVNIVDRRSWPLTSSIGLLLLVILIIGLVCYMNKISNELLIFLLGFFYFINKKIIYEIFIDIYHNKNFVVNYYMLTILKTISKLKDNWPKISFNRKFFLKYFNEEQSKFLKEVDIIGRRVGHPEFLTIVNIDKENYFCIGNISHNRIIVTNDNKYLEGKLVGYDKQNRPLYFIIEDLRIKKVDFTSIDAIFYDIVSNICKADYPIYLKDNYQMQINILFCIDVYFKNKGYQDYFVHHKILDLKSFSDQTELILKNIKDDLLIIHDKND